ncbi:MAG: SDR family oxidoreductase [Rhodospirillaceae bacterium]|jgi:3-oxoacyl-[acyl-carrier protein] reductase|nr:SDR family oxidoreductase [Rhodospirillaceae bacterium]MBT5455947.1 SDR family oxidoreductase [Rhodospirillaceae bacterium]
MDLGIAGRKALVTGGSLGIGRACADLLVAEGVDVAIAARNEERLGAVASDIASGTNARVIPIAGDLSVASDTERVVAEAAEALGQIDILVNNAGSAPLGLIGDIDDASWQSSFDLKLMGYVRCARTVMPAMRARRWGRIINIIGNGGHFPTAKYIAGGAINAAILNITQALAEECGPDNVLVNGVNPTATATDRWAELVKQRVEMTGETEEQIYAQSAARNPLGRIGEPEDIANMVVFLCSERASFVNGALIEVDGGVSRAL